METKREIGNITEGKVEQRAKIVDVCRRYKIDVSLLNTRKSFIIMLSKIPISTEMNKKYCLIKKGDLSKNRGLGQV
jgi:hypothetical protein